MPKRIIDQSLIDSILNVNKDLFHVITDEFEDAIYFHVLKIVNNKEVAQDLTNDTFVKVYKNLSSFDHKRKFSTWIYRIATNTAIDYLRRLKLAPDIAKQSEETNQIADASNPEQDMIWKQNYASLKDAVGLLSEDYRNIINLRYFKELSYEEISQRLNIPIGTVKAQLHRARQKLAKIITNQIK